MPATVGWRRPTLLLPADWRDWGETDRRAVVAHELAHVRRGDYVAGVWAQFCVAFHFYQPLVHWLTARLRLEQELAADAWAHGSRGATSPICMPWRGWLCAVTTARRRGRHGPSFRFEEP